MVAGMLVTRDVVVDGFLDWAYKRFGQYDAATAPGVVAPTTLTASGSPASLEPWATLGEYGRSFVATATTPAELRAFHGPAADVEQPIRVYAGLRSAGSPDQRAALAVQELERTGAFQREILAVVTTTGTGWVDPNAASSLQYPHGGDTSTSAGRAPGRESPQAARVRGEPGLLRGRGGVPGLRRGNVAGQPGRRVGRGTVHRPHRLQPHLGPAHRRPPAGLPRSGARSTRAAPGSSSPTGPPTWSAPTPAGGAPSGPVRAPSLGSGRERDP
jgi:hypothetical protein